MVELAGHGTTPASQEFRGRAIHAAYQPLRFEHGRMSLSRDGGWVVRVCRVSAGAVDGDFQGRTDLPHACPGQLSQSLDEDADRDTFHRVQVHR